MAEFKTFSSRPTAPPQEYLERSTNRTMPKFSRAPSSSSVGSTTTSSAVPPASSAAAAAVHAAAAAAQSANAPQRASDPLVDADLQFKKMALRFQKAPILGLAQQQRQRYKHLKSKVDKIRAVQQEIFFDQFNQFPDVSQHQREDYAAIWNAFKTKDEEVDALTAKLGVLCQQIDGVSKLANRDSSQGV